MKIKINDIVIGSRHRNDTGDIEDLAANIKTVGLLQPLCVTPKNALVDGWRRLLAVQTLGWSDIECHVHDIGQIADGEFSSLIYRKNYTLSELAALTSRSSRCSINRLTNAKSRVDGGEARPSIGEIHRSQKTAQTEKPVVARKWAVVLVT